MAATSTTTAASSSSVRYDRFLSVFQKALAKAKSKVDIDKVIAQVYGDDASIFADHQLHSLVENLLDTLNEQVESDMMQYFEEHQVEQKLLVVERLLKNLKAQDAAQSKAFHTDKESTQKALNAVKLPDGLRPMDAVNYQRYQAMLADQKQLQKDMTAAQDEIEQLEQKQADAQAQVSQKASQIQEVGSVMEACADMCS
jgi:hypothetical protein